MKLELKGFCQAHSNFKAAILFGKFDITRANFHGLLLFVNLAPPFISPLCCLILCKGSSVKPIYVLYKYFS